VVRNSLPAGKTKKLLTHGAKVLNVRICEILEFSPSKQKKSPKKGHSKGSKSAADDTVEVWPLFGSSRTVLKSHESETTDVHGQWSPSSAWRRTFDASLLLPVDEPGKGRTY